MSSPSATMLQIVLDLGQVHGYKRAMILELIRGEIERSGKTRYWIAQQTGISQEQLCRFMQGRSLTVPSVEKLLAFFSYEIRKRKGGNK
jgi:hypothetical protein